MTQSNEIACVMTETGLIFVPENEPAVLRNLAMTLGAGAVLLAPPYEESVVRELADHLPRIGGSLLEADARSRTWRFGSVFVVATTRDSSIKLSWAVWPGEGVPPREVAANLMFVARLSQELRAAGALGPKGIHPARVEYPAL